MAGLNPDQTRTPDGVVGGWIGGTGPDLVLLHGFGGDAAWCWHPQVSDLGRGRRLHLPDLLHFGRSFAASHRVELEDQVAAAVTWIDQFAAGPVDLVGISYGGLVAQALAAAHPQKVSRLVLVASPGHVYDQADHQRLLSSYAASHPADIVVPDAPEDVRRLIELAWHRPPPTPRPVLRWVHRGMFQDRIAQKRALLDALVRLGEQGDRSAWSVPHRTLLVGGAADPLFPIALLRRLVAALPRAQAVILPETRHAPNLEDPARFNRLVLNFLRDLPVTQGQQAPGPQPAEP